jgi:small subunit ribosomal protein S6
MPLYESVFIARQDISAAQVESLTDSLTNIIAEQGGEVKKKEYWGLKNLSFRIKKNRKGHYTLFNIDAPAAAVLEMERNMRLNEDVLRYLTVRVDELEEGPSAMLQSRHRDREGGGRFRDRDDRPRRDRDRDRGGSSGSASGEGKGREGREGGENA